MKNVAILVLMLQFGTAVVCGASESAAIGHVAVTDFDIPTDEWDAKAAMWRRFADLPVVSQFARTRVNAWRSVYQPLVDSLLRKATEENLEAGALKAIISDIESKRGSRAMLPVAAIRVHQGDRKAWIVVCVWEHEGGSETIVMGHTCMYGYDVGSLRRIAYETCL